MATESAHRRLWQLPTFLAGLGALWAVWHYGDRLRPSVAERYEKALFALKPAVDRWPPDPDQVRAALRKLPDAEPPTELASRVKYMRGSAYVALAEATVSPSEAAEWWALARTDLEAVVDREFGEGDQKKLRYRLARTWYHSPGTDPNRTIAALTKYVSAGDDASEGHRMLAELHLNSRPPNEPAARDALKNFLKHSSSRADSRTINESRVRLSDLHAKLGEADDAKKVLERVGPDAPPELYAAARLKIAVFLRTTDDWAGAVKVWEQVRDMQGASDDQHAEARVRLAEAYIKLGRDKDADTLVKDIGKNDTPEGRAAWFRRAELALKEPGQSKDAAVTNLERAYAGTVPDELRKLVRDADAQRVCQAVYQQARTDGEHATAVRVAAVLAKAVPGEVPSRLTVEAHEAWAAAAARDPSRAEEAREHYRAAADACLAAGRAESAVVARADWLRKAADLFLKAGDRPKALAVLTDLTGRLTDYPEDRAGHIWAAIGDVFRAAGEQEQARSAFQNAASRPGPAQIRARVRFAALAYEIEPDVAANATIKALRDVLALKPPADRDVCEEAQFLLGEIHLLRREWPEADAALKAALETYPNGPRVARGRYQYGQVLRHSAYDAAQRIKTDRATLEQIKAERLTARQPSLKVDEEIKLVDRLDRAQKTYEEMMRRAYDEFCKAEELMLAKPDVADPAALRRTSFWAADCAYWLGEFGECAARVEKLATRYRGRAEELEASRDLHRCSLFAAQAARDAKNAEVAATWTKKAAEALARVKDGLDRVPGSEFDGATEARKKSYWEAWLAQNAPMSR